MRSAWGKGIEVGGLPASQRLSKPATSAGVIDPFGHKRSPLTR
jgi:hypothetical protein